MITKFNLDKIANLFQNYRVSFYNGNDYIEAKFMMTLTYHKYDYREQITKCNGVVEIECYGSQKYQFQSAIYTINKHKPLIFHIADTEMKNDAEKYNL